MVSIGLTSLLVSVGVFSLVLFSVQAEEKRGQRFFLTEARGWLDGVVSTAGRRLVSSWEHFLKYIVQLGWYYGLHSLLQGVLRALVSFYQKVEYVFELNRQRAKQLRAEKKQVATLNETHLTEMAKHKAETALTPTQQRKLRDTQLEGE